MEGSVVAKIEWKTREEIEAEKNAPKPPAPEEQIEALKKAVAELTYLVSTGGM